jgi:hypothetical protein
MASSIAEVVATAKTGLWQLLSTTPGLTDTDGVRVASAAVGPDELGTGTSIVELHDVTIGTAAGARPDMGGSRSGTPTISGWVTVTYATGGEDAIQAARTRVTAIVGLVERTVRQATAGDPTAGGIIQGPGGLAVAVSGLQEGPADWKGQAVRRAAIPFTITWTSHVT